MNTHNGSPSCFGGGGRDGFGLLLLACSETLPVLSAIVSLCMRDEAVYGGRRLEVYQWIFVCVTARILRVYTEIGGGSDKMLFYY